MVLAAVLTLGLIVRGESPNSLSIQTAKMFRPNKEVEPEGITR